MHCIWGCSAGGCLMDWVPTRGLHAHHETSLRCCIASETTELICILHCFLCKALLSQISCTILHLGAQYCKGPLSSGLNCSRLLHGGGGGLQLHCSAPLSLSLQETLPSSLQDAHPLSTLELNLQTGAQPAPEKVRDEKWLYTASFWISEIQSPIRSEIRSDIRSEIQS